MNNKSLISLGLIGAMSACNCLSLIAIGHDEDNSDKNNDESSSIVSKSSDENSNEKDTVEEPSTKKIKLERTDFNFWDDSDTDSSDTDSDDVDCRLFQSPEDDFYKGDCSIKYHTIPDSDYNKIYKRPFNISNINKNKPIQNHRYNSLPCPLSTAFDDNNDDIQYSIDGTELIRYSSECQEKLLQIPDGVTTMFENVLNFCCHLTTLEMPASLTNIGCGVLCRGCDNLMSINVNDNNPKYKSIDGVLYSKDGTRLIRCPQGKAGILQIPDGVTTVSLDAFYECSNINGFELPTTFTDVYFCKYHIRNIHLRGNIAEYNQDIRDSIERCN